MLRFTAFVTLLMFITAPVWPEAEPMLRGVWIHSWGDGILSPQQCEEFVAQVREANLNAIFPEVRKVGDAYYLKGFEPRANNIQGPEDWDTLQHLIDLCHDTSDGKQRIEVHAWLVTFRIWTTNAGSEYPEGHLLALHPEVVMLNAEGQASAEGTQFADPGHPITQDWTARVFRNLAEQYDIDGIHHDYVRYPEYASDWGHNAVSLERFRRRTGFEGKPEPDDPRWQAWRRSQVLDSVRRVYAEVKEVNPDCAVSAATLNWGLEMSPWDWLESRPRTQAHQDWVAFMQEGILDLNCLMNYSRHVTQPHRFPDYTHLAIRQRSDRHAVIGVGAYLNNVDHTFEQMRMAMDEGADGILIYAYQGTNNEDVPRGEFFRRLREEVFPEPAPVPERPWIDNPNAGMVIGQVTDDEGDWADGALVTLNGVETMLTDGTGFYAFLRQKPGEHIVQVTDEEGEEHRRAVTVEAGGVTRANFTLD
jgi:uncharacterized lipoprotein YddW (UPF0748 family)